MARVSPWGISAFVGPDAASADTGPAATLLRLAPVAMDVLKLTGYGSIVSYAYRAFETGGLAAVLMSPETRVFCERIMPVLRRHFLLKSESPEQEASTLTNKLTASLSSSTKLTSEASELALRLYYFGCATAIDRLSRQSIAVPSDDTSINEAMRLAGGEAIGASQWLYVARALRPPHHMPEWAAWYCSRIAAPGGWTIVACVGASRAESDQCVVPRLPPTPFPAWCLAVRSSTKTALLSIRGSVTQADWAINSHIEAAPIDGGLCHHGMLAAARAILDDCGCLKLIERLFEQGYDLKLVGHSLGAGVAVLITHLLGSDARRAGRALDCVAYATPACVSPDLADSLRSNVLSVVHRDDLVPRLSDANCARLAKDLVADDMNYKRRLTADKVSLTDHLRSLGKANAMVHNTEDDDDGTRVASDAHLAEPQLKMALRAASTDGDDDVKIKNDDQPAVPEAKDETMPSAPRLVVPGRILYLDNYEGSYIPVLGDHRTLASQLDRVIISSHAVEDHRMEAHLEALREARWSRGYLPPIRSRPAFQPAVRNNQYEPCSCCGSNTTWTSLAPGSDSARAYSTHHCRACGKIVCAFCAPAADIVAGDGIGQTLRLPDCRLSLPSFSYFAPVRICHPCAFAAYDL